MAIWFLRSRLAHHLGQRIGSLDALKLSSWASSLHPWIPPSLDSSDDRYASKFLRNPMDLYAARRFRSAKAQESVPVVTDGSNQVMDFPGGKVMFVPELRFLAESPGERISCYRILDDDGKTISGSSFQEVSKEIALKMYSDMVTLQIMDTIFYEAQRQGRISFYLTTIGEEAINIASAAALTIDDIVFPQYREPGVLLWRGFTLQEFANQCFGNKLDYGKGRQMPIHYGSNRLNYFTVSSPIATQVPHAVGAAYSLKMDKKHACAVTYFGDGGTSEGDFHAALNFAAVMEVPVIFFCRNNGWAISTPTAEQFRSDGAVIRGQAYGIRSIRVDGNDALAVYSAVHAAREMAIRESRPILVEALTYRVGHHSTSDDSTKYRPVDEIEHWRTARDPVSRYRKWIERNGWWCDDAESELRSNVRKELLHAVQVAERMDKPPLAELFTDVYDQVPSNLREQERLLTELIKQHPGDYPPEVPV
ncbi:2-oxoisovalerate dehydrogenase subunit alpha 2, mitochondrial isoform X2 [Phoenix dactylifera]|uniref:3-methyl-2-oxobutanoate dehydrogenase (2-methylpropanoyl-transferring) n=1 Tax=Phoenix dactylifera TaxID=42345 RepID=A0A8B7CXX4_PHODC|nr:2-oxoisovalerate dehydrogenase subunit alpha 2, mitochondrial isoform X2 [Phoenix dactylifera]XP_008808486.1 2-oxoisovalerate dehydrogenase subunit alpha 2, mitochondrial isoform X2 [Phoenix dactylifera]XP_026665584.1 2-oxoisovalerate dehydrogenase subunit alpha 2, mitochondrial isoform X2 [Phoenix dactylifera]XP_026665585.1 2-oxoisovalerate dehydrogenase subunit alpha 2, mitochondrial isoform X2 [Phoenix dactylifera]XP_026665586.1 2-oxoisovalerate dehydrogenase subunit alpha 2, mitochondria